MLLWMALLLVLLLLLILLLMMMMILRVLHMRLTKSRLLHWSRRWRKGVRCLNRVTWRLLLLMMMIMLMLHLRSGHLLLMPHALLLQRSSIPRRSGESRHVRAAARACCRSAAV